MLRQRRAVSSGATGAPAHDLQPPRLPRPEELVRVDLAQPAQEVPLGLGLRAAEDGRPELRLVGNRVEQLLAPLAPDAALVTVLDGHPAAHAWMGAVRGQRVVPLGVDHFGQSGDIPDLYREYGLDTDSILDACAQALLG